MTDEAELREIASACSRIVEYWAGAAGFSGFDLAERYGPLARLVPSEQFRVMVLLATVPVIATVGMRGDQYGCGVSGWRFWVRHRAPPQAFHSAAN